MPRLPLRAWPALSAMTRRTNFWKFFLNRFGDLNRPENFDRCITAMMQYERLAVLNTDWERLRRDFQQGEPTYAELFALLEGQAWAWSAEQRRGRSRGWGAPLEEIWWKSVEERGRTRTVGARIAR